ncbi:polysaccharide deacetylase family protein [Bacillus sp. M6-12]|uniref:polysaccharide deacetylase family protein n=1 Tax=Bacillus sp. M6-12 TaxID=2054166 RepID=UPI0015E15B7E|nr:polysaccharide deacetylase family protein [Bacillus sp. M6-12]
MQKYIKSIMLLVTIILGIYLIPEESEAAGLTYIKAVQDTPVYSTSGSTKITVGNLLKGQEYALTGSDSQNYHIMFGNGRALISKRNAVVLAKPANQVNISYTKPGKSGIITQRKTVIYDKTDKNKRAIAVINTNIRFPVLSKTGEWYRISIGNRIGYIPSGNVKEDPGIPVLMYHHMLEHPELTAFKNNDMVIPVSAFEEQMKYLKSDGWKAINGQELERYLNHEQVLTGKAVLISFDDGYTSTQKYAYPILKEHGLKATQFVIGGRTYTYASPWDENTLQYLGYREMQEMEDVFDYQHHTFGMHLRESGTLTPYLILKTYEQIVEDMERGRQHLGKATGNPDNIKYLAYPWGQYDEETIEAVKAAGITMAFTTETGNVKLGDNLLKLKRQGIAPRHSLADFVNKLKGTYVDPRVKKPNPVEKPTEKVVIGNTPQLLDKNAQTVSKGKQK